MHNFAMQEGFDLRRLRHFVAVAEAGSFSRAAERLSVAQPHLSRQIMLLEEGLQHRLLVRRPRHVELTDAGRALLQVASGLFGEIERIPQRLNEAATGRFGSLRIGFTDCGSFHQLPARIIERLMHAAPQLTLTFCRGSRAQLIQAIQEREIQAAFVRPPALLPPNITLDPLQIERMLLAHNMPGLVPKVAEITYTELAEMTTLPFILLPREEAPELYDGLMAACLRCGYSPRVLFHMPQASHGLLLAARGAGLVPVPEMMACVHIDGLHFVPFASSVLSTGLALISRADEQAGAVKLLRRQAIEAAGTEAEPGR